MGGVGWHSAALRALYEALGWIAFVAWSLSFYPQALLNYERKSVTGLNFDFVVFNLTKHTSYFIFNASLFFSAVVQEQYHQKYGPQELIPVSASDVAFSTHAVILTAFTAYQIYIYDRGSQTISVTCKAISAVVWASIALSLFIALQTSSWLWLATFFNYVQVLMTTIKYIPQAWFNMRRRSTVGWSISNVLLDISGGLGTFLQMFLLSIDQSSFVNFTGNVGKVALSVETLFFDVLFIVQHYLLYPAPAHHLPLRKAVDARAPPGTDSDPLLIARGEQPQEALEEREEPRTYGTVSRSH